MLGHYVIPSTTNIFIKMVAIWNGNFYLSEQKVLFLYVVEKRPINKDENKHPSHVRLENKKSLCSSIINNS